MFVDRSLHLCIRNLGKRNNKKFSIFCLKNIEFFIIYDDKNVYLTRQNVCKKKIYS